MGDGSDVPKGSSWETSGKGKAEKDSCEAKAAFASGLFIPADARLLDILKKQGKARVRSKEWLLRFIDDLYRFEGTAKK